MQNLLKRQNVSKNYNSTWTYLQGAYAVDMHEVNSVVFTLSQVTGDSVTTISMSVTQRGGEGQVEPLDRKVSNRSKRKPRLVGSM